MLPLNKSFNILSRCSQRLTKIFTLLSSSGKSIEHTYQNKSINFTILNIIFPYFHISLNVRLYSLLSVCYEKKYRKSLAIVMVIFKQHD